MRKFFKKGVPVNGLCAACRQPVADGEKYQFRDGGLCFHRTCAETSCSSSVKQEMNMAEMSKEMKGETNKC